MHCTAKFISCADMTLTKSPWSVIGACNCSGNESSAKPLPFCRSYDRTIRSRGTATVPRGQRPDEFGNTMCERWLALSVFLPSQQLGNSRIRWIWLPCGHSGYFVVVRFVSPLHVHLARALAGPLVSAFASPVMTRRNCGIAQTFAWLLPPNSSRTDAGFRMTPTLPSLPPPSAF